MSGSPVAVAVVETPGSPARSPGSPGIPGLALSPVARTEPPASPSPRVASPPERGSPLRSPGASAELPVHVMQQTTSEIARMIGAGERGDPESDRLHMWTGTFYLGSSVCMPPRAYRSTLEALGFEGEPASCGDVLERLLDRLDFRIEVGDLNSNPAARLACAQGGPGAQRLWAARTAHVPRRQHFPVPSRADGRVVYLINRTTGAPWGFATIEGDGGRLAPAAPIRLDDDDADMRALWAPGRPYTIISIVVSTDERIDGAVLSQSPLEPTRRRVVRFDGPIPRVVPEYADFLPDPVQLLAAVVMHMTRGTFSIVRVPPAQWPKYGGAVAPDQDFAAALRIAFGYQPLFYVGQSRGKFDPEVGFAVNLPRRIKADGGYGAWKDEFLMCRPIRAGPLGDAELTLAYLDLAYRTLVSP